MVLAKTNTELPEGKTDITSAKRRRLRRQRLKKAAKHSIEVEQPEKTNNHSLAVIDHSPAVPKPEIGIEDNTRDLLKIQSSTKNIQLDMSSKESAKSREDVIAAREAKKLAKQKAKNKDSAENTAPILDLTPKNDTVVAESTPKKDTAASATQKKDATPKVETNKNSPKSKDEVDRAAVKESTLVKENASDENQKTKEQILAERAAKKTAKQAKKKGTEEITPNPDMTVKDVVETLKDIKNVAKDIQDITAKVSAINFEAKKQPEDSSKSKAGEEGKSKAELKAERRAKQEAQRAAKLAEQKAAKPKTEAVTTKPSVKSSDDTAIKEKSPKPKADKPKLKSISANRVNWFQHLYAEHDKDTLNKIPLNSNLHPAIIKLGVQLASRVITGSNARCIALLNALKHMVRDYTLPARTEFARGLEAHLALHVQWVWAARPPAASQTNAVKFLRHHLTQLPNNIDEFDAKKILLEEIDKYIEDQIDKAGEAISMTVQKKISNGDTILTYGSSSLIERILREAWAAGLQFRAVVVGDRVQCAARAMLRRLAAAGLPCTYADITAITHLMNTVDKVILGAGAVLANGSVVSRAGTAAAALCARARNVPVLVAAETHKFSDRVHTDAFVYNELGDPDALIDKSDENSPLKDWRNNPNLTPLNLTYDVTPASLVTAVVTEKAILPCTSAPVVLRTKLIEYGM